MNKIVLDRVTGDFGFDAKDESGHIVKIDGAESIGGMGSGARPMQLLLMGLGGCSGIDIVSILKKQRQVVEDLSIKLEGQRDQDKIPSLWKSVKITFEFKGNIDEAKAQRACELSMEKHCSVAETLRLGGTEIKWSFTISNTL